MNENSIASNGPGTPGVTENNQTQEQAAAHTVHPVNPVKDQVQPPAASPDPPAPATCPDLQVATLSAQPSPLNPPPTDPVIRPDPTRSDHFPGRTQSDENTLNAQPSPLNPGSSTGIRLDPTRS